jgi:hypothetical protein
MSELLFAIGQKNVSATVPIDEAGGKPRWFVKQNQFGAEIDIGRPARLDVRKKTL